jgi:hypothetical protein
MARKSTKRKAGGGLPETLSKASITRFMSSPLGLGIAAVVLVAVGAKLASTQRVRDAAGNAGIFVRDGAGRTAGRMSDLASDVRDRVVVGDPEEREARSRVRRMRRDAVAAFSASEAG